MGNFKQYFLESNNPGMLSLLEDSDTEEIANKSNLNQVFWTDDDPPKLQSDVRDVLLKVASDVKESLTEELEEPFEYNKLIFTGSLTGSNFDLTSDVDLHFLLDIKQYELVYDKYLKFYAANFNQKGYHLLQHPLEIYFQDENEPHQSPGIYDVTDDEWIQESDSIKIDIDPDVLVEAQKKLKEIEEFMMEYGQQNPEPEEFLEKIIQYKEELKVMRKKGLASEDGMYSFENLVFKQMRRNGALEKMLELIRTVRDDIYEVER